MSKFKVNTTKFEQTFISSQDMDRLFELLVSKIPKLDKTVNKSILKMKQTGHKYRLLTFGKDYVVVKKCKSQILCGTGLSFSFGDKKLC